MIDRTGLVEVLHNRREALQPEDVGLPRGPRRRTNGLRREEVASLGLYLSLDERDHLFRLAGHNPPDRGASTEHTNPGLLRGARPSDDTPAEIVTELGETLRQSPMGVALTGDDPLHRAKPTR